MPCLNPLESIRTCEGWRNGLLLSQLVSALLALLKTFASSNAKFSCPAKHDPRWIQHDSHEKSWKDGKDVSRCRKMSQATATQLDTQREVELQAEAAHLRRVTSHPPGRNMPKHAESDRNWWKRWSSTVKIHLPRLLRLLRPPLGNEALTPRRRQWFPSEQERRRKLDCFSCWIHKRFCKIKAGKVCARRKMKRRNGTTRTNSYLFHQSIEVQTLAPETMCASEVPVLDRQRGLEIRNCGPHARTIPKTSIVQLHTLSWSLVGTK